MMLEENCLFPSAAVQGAERVPSGLQGTTYWEWCLSYAMSRLFVSCRSWSAVGKLILTITVLGQCVNGVVGVTVCGLYWLLETCMQQMS